MLLIIFAFFVAQILTFDDQNWIWIDGPRSEGDESHYNLLGEYHSDNYPGRGRYPAIYNVDDRYIYLFGGESHDTKGVSKSYSRDWWIFDLQANMWAKKTHLDESTTTSRIDGTFGGQFHALNRIGHRTISSGSNVVEKTVDDSILYVMGGRGFGISSFGELGDIWKYSTKLDLWANVAGKYYVGYGPFYGPKNVYQFTYGPGGRYGGAFWRYNNKFYHFGGYGKMAPETPLYNDIFEYDESKGWAWVAGNDSSNCVSENSNAPDMVPSSRAYFSHWMDPSNGYVYFYGGQSVGGNVLADLWKYKTHLQIFIKLYGFLLEDQPVNAECYYPLGLHDSSVNPGSLIKSSMVMFDDKIYIIGGDQMSGGGVTNAIFEYDLKETYTLALAYGDCENVHASEFNGNKGDYSANTVMGSRKDIRSTVFNGSTIIIYGGKGYDEYDYEKLNDLYMFKMEGSAGENDYETYFKYLSGSKNKGKFVEFPFYGGEGNGIPARRRGMSFAKSNNGKSVLMFGGSGEINFEFGLLSDFWEYRLSPTNDAQDGGEWYFLNGLPFLDSQPETGSIDGCHGWSICMIGSRKYHTMTQISDELYVIYGGFGFGEWFYVPNVLESFWMYNITARGIKPIMTAKHGNQKYTRWIAKGEFSIANFPGLRYGHAAVILGNYYVIFGGEDDNDRLYNDVFINDIENDLQFNIWNFAAGNGSVGAFGPYYYGGTKNVYYDNVFPASRRRMTYWKYDSSSFIIFGGETTQKFGESNVRRPVNDIWMYNITINQWKWLFKGDSLYEHGVYASSTEFNSLNRPGSRYKSFGWMLENDENLYIFGGEGLAAIGTTPSFLNDFWVFNMTVLQWKFIIGESNGNMNGNYGFDVKSAVPGGYPGGRCSGGSITIDGKFVFFGGWGLDAVYQSSSKANNQRDFWVNQMTYSCFGYVKTHPLTCSGRGECVGDGECECFDGYYGEMCEITKCFGIIGNKTSKVCYGRGKCKEKNKCLCDFGSFGEECQIPSCQGKRSDDAMACGLFGKCENIDVCDCGTLFKGNNCDNMQEWAIVVVTIPILVLVIVILLAICIFVTFLCKNNLSKVFTTFKAINKLDNIELLLEEQELEKDTSIAHLKINKKLFEIDYAELKIVKSIGKGGGSNAVVYHCKYQNTDVAFKCFKIQDFLSQDKFNLFEREAELLSGLKHPFIISFFGCTLRNPRIGIVLEYCALGDFKQFLKYYKQTTEMPYPVKDKLRILSQIASGMSYLHSKKVIHRDLKCDNVLIDDSKKPKIMDFGISKMIEDATKTKTRRIGTTYYIAPEVTLGNDYDSKCDVFSFAMLAFEVISEIFEPFGKVSYALEFKVAEDPNFRPKMEKGVGNFEKNWVILLIKRCWSEIPKDRPSFEEIVKIIEENMKLNKEEEIKKEKEIEKMLGKSKDVVNRKNEKDVLKELKEARDVLKNDVNNLMKEIEKIKKKK